MNSFESIGFRASTFAFEVGARGLVPFSVDFLLDKLGIKKQRKKIVKKGLSLMSLQCSKRIFISREIKVWNSFQD